MFKSANDARVCAWLIASLVAVMAGACGDDDDGAAGSGGGNSEGPLYAVMYEVFTDEGSDSYLSIFNSLDLTEVDTGSARELAGGRAFMQTYNEWIFVGEPGTADLHRFSLDANGELNDEQVLSFSNYGLTEVSIDDWCINFISPQKAYYFDYVEGITIIFNPTTMTLIGEIEAPAGYVHADADFVTGTSTAVVRDDRLFRTVYWYSNDTGEHLDQQLLTVYDVESDALISTTEYSTCPATSNRAHMAEDGTIYFSNWIWNVGGTFLDGKRRSCVLRINPGEEAFDDAWTFSYGDIADGREGAMFTYLEDDKALVSIFHDENVPEGSITDVWELAGTPNWEVWNVDMNTMTGAPVDGIPLNTGAFTPVHMDGRVFVMIPGADWANTQLYEVDGDSATARVNIPGWSYMFKKVR